MSTGYDKPNWHSIERDPKIDTEPIDSLLLILSDCDGRAEPRADRAREELSRLASSDDKVIDYLISQIGSSTTVPGEIAAILGVHPAKIARAVPICLSQLCDGKGDPYSSLIMDAGKNNIEYVIGELKRELLERPRIWEAGGWILAALACEWTKAAASISEWLKSPDEGLCAAALTASEDPISVDEFDSAMNSDSAFVRAAAAGASLRMPRRFAAHINLIVTKGLVDEEEYVWRHVQLQLRNLSDFQKSEVRQAILPILFSIVSDVSSTSQTQVAAIRAIGFLEELCDEPLARLLRIASDESKPRQVREAAELVLRGS